MPEIFPFSKVIQALLDDQNPFPPKFLHRFSDITPEDLKSLHDAWPKITSQRKYALLEDLDALSEDDTLMSFEELARSLLQDEDPAIRVRIISLLWENPDIKLLPTYFSIIKEGTDIESRAAAVSILGQYIYHGELEEIPAHVLHEVEEILLTLITEDQHDLVRRHALEALGASSRIEVPPLIESSYHRKEIEWIISALYSMGRSCDERWEKYIIAQISNPDEDISMEAIRSAGKLGLSSARAALLDILEDEEDLNKRKEMIWSLSSIGGEGVREKIEELLAMEGDDSLVDILEEAQENLLLTEGLDQFELMSFDDGDLEEMNTGYSTPEK